MIDLMSIQMDVFEQRRRERRLGCRRSAVAVRAVCSPWGISVIISVIVPKWYLQVKSFGIEESQVCLQRIFNSNHELSFCLEYHRNAKASLVFDTPHIECSPVYFWLFWSRMWASPECKYRCTMALSTHKESSESFEHLKRARRFICFCRVNTFVSAAS